MILKHADSKAPQIAELERLLTIAPSDHRPKIEQELRILQAGIKGEKEAAYFIDFDLKDSKNTAVIHDLRLEINGRVAQIDHLLIHRTMVFFVLETKHFHAGLKIGEDGQFLQWNNYKKTFEGMASPLAQNERHITVLKDIVSQTEWPTRIGFKLVPSYESFVLVSSKARIDRPQKFDTSRVIKSDDLSKTIDNTLGARGFLEVFGALAKMISSESLQTIGQSIVAQHLPLTIDYAGKFGLTGQTSETTIQSSTQEPSPGKSQVGAQEKCRTCGGVGLAIQYGRYGYYFKCSACEGNTPIKINCGKDGHSERIRKEGQNFYRECADCGSSTIYFVNP